MRKLTQLTENAFSIYNRLQHSGVEESELFREIVDYITSMMIAMSSLDEELPEGEGDLLMAFTSVFEGIGSPFPRDNFVYWADAKYRESKGFIALAASIDQQSDSGSAVALVILWHIKNIVMTLVQNKGEIKTKTIELGQIFLSHAEEIVASKGVASELDIFDFPADLIAAFTPEREYLLSPKSSPEESVEDLLSELNRLAGLDSIKSEVSALVNLVKMRALRQSRGMTMPDISLHMVFSGRPGTGKTTIGRLLGKIYRSLGVLSKGHLVEVDRSSLVAGYVGQTAIKCKEALEKARGGLLFIDEAYALSRGSENDYGQEAIDTILKYMEDHRDEIVVIAAGYENEMVRFISSNPGLQSRFNKFLNFEDYSIDQLYTIFLGLAESHEYYYCESVASKIYENLDQLRKMKGKSFANARDVRNAFESIVQEQANRIATFGEGEDNLGLHTIIDSDVDIAFERILLA